MMIIKILKEFWEEQYFSKVLSTLSGSSYKQTVEALKVSHLVFPNINVLEVGIGVGEAVKGFKQRECNVYALDISRIALNNIRGYCNAVYTLEELDRIPSNFFDLIVSLNLVQHIPYDVLKMELSAILRSLKKGGVFAFEFVSSDKFIETYYEEKERCYCYSPEIIQETIIELGGIPEFVNSLTCKQGRITGIHIVHIKK